MITKNFKLWQSALMSKVNADAETITLPKTMVDVDGVERNIVYLSGYMSSVTTFNSANETTLTHNKNGMCLLVGTNDEAVTENDYTISAIETVSSAVAQTITRIIDNDGKFAMQITRTLQNTAEQDITIKELGLFFKMSFVNSTYKNCLFAREVLDTPIVVPAGGKFTVSMIVKV